MTLQQVRFVPSLENHNRFSITIVFCRHSVPDPYQTRVSVSYFSTVVCSHNCMFGPVSRIARLVYRKGRPMMSESSDGTIPRVRSDIAAVIREPEVCLPVYTVLDFTTSLIAIPACYFRHTPGLEIFGPFWSSVYSGHWDLILEIQMSVPLRVITTSEWSRSELL